MIIFAVSIHSFDAVVRDFPTAALSNILVVDVLSVKVRLPVLRTLLRIASRQCGCARCGEQSKQLSAGRGGPVHQRCGATFARVKPTGQPSALAKSCGQAGPVDSLRRVVCGCLLGPSETDPVASAWADGGHRVHSPDVRPRVGTVREHCRCSLNGSQQIALKYSRCVCFQ